MIIFKTFDVLKANKEEWSIFHSFRKVFHREEYSTDLLVDDDSFENLLRGYVEKGDIKFSYYSIFDKEKQIGLFSYYYFSETSPSFNKNEKLVTFDIKLLKKYRRQGIGSQALKIIVEQNEKIGKSVFKTKYDNPDSFFFIKSIGANIAFTYSENELNMVTLDESLLHEWIKEASGRNKNTEIKILEGNIPDLYINEFVTTYMESQNSQPRDNLEGGTEVITVEQYRKDEVIMHSTGYKVISVLAFEKNGKISGLTQVKISNKDENLQQGITGVSLLFRGNKIAKWIKAELLLYVKKNYPHAKTIITSNTESNETMNHINSLLGFKCIKKVNVIQVNINQLKIYLKTKTFSDLPENIITA